MPGADPLLGAALELGVLPFSVVHKIHDVEVEPPRLVTRVAPSPHPLPPHHSPRTAAQVRGVPLQKLERLASKGPLLLAVRPPPASPAASRSATTPLPTSRAAEGGGGGGDGGGGGGGGGKGGGGGAGGGGDSPSPAEEFAEEPRPAAEDPLEGKERRVVRTIACSSSGK